MAPDCMVHTWRPRVVITRPKQTIAWLNARKWLIRGL